MFEKSFEKLILNLGLLWTRLAFGGLMFLAHGIGKIDRLGTLGTEDVKFGDTLNLSGALGLDPVTAKSMQLLLIVFAEALCSVLIVVGLATRLAAIPLIIAMCVAAFVAHGGDPPLGFGEKALLFGFGFSVIAVLGPGRFSLDAYVIPALAKRREKKKKRDKKEQKKQG